MKRKHKGRLTTEERNNMKSSTFGLPKERKYPMPNRKYAINAKGRATQQVKKGKLSKAKEGKIDRKADKIIYGKGKKGRNDQSHKAKMVRHYMR